MLSSCMVEECDPKLSYEWLLKKHYAKRIPQILHCYQCRNGDSILGYMTFGLPPMPQINDILSADVWELNRLIMVDNHCKNLTSYFMGRVLRLLLRYSPKVLLSYADPNNGHHGYIYQATNWLYTGTGGDKYMYVDTDNGRQFHSRWDELHTNIERIRVKEKHRYIYLLMNKAQKKRYITTFPWQILPYPKGDNINYDASYKTSDMIPMF